MGFKITLVVISPCSSDPQPIFFSDFYITLEAEIWHATKVHKYRMIQDVLDICADNICQQQQPIMDFENGVIVKIYKS